MTTPDTEGRTRSRTLIAFGVLALAVAEVATALGGAAVFGLSFAAVRDSYLLTNSVIALSCAVAGWLIAWQRPGNPVGWLLVTAGVLQAATAATALLLIATPRLHWSEPAARTLTTVLAYAWPWSITLCLPMALLVFPDGRPPGPRWRVFLVTIALDGVLFTLGAGSDPGGFPGGAHPWFFAPDSRVFAAVATFSELLNALNYVACLVGLVLRYRRGGEQQRRQLLWLALALLAMLGMLAVWVPSPDSGPLVLVLLVIPLVPASITIAVLRYNLLDIRLVFTRALLYGVLTGAAITTYLGVVALADQAVGRNGGEGSHVVASLVVAVAFNPVRIRLQRGIDSLFYGDRADPVRAVSRLGSHLAQGRATADPGDALAVVADALRLPYAALRVGDAVTAAHGAPTGALETVPLTYGGERVGDLVVGVRSGQGRLSASDRAVLELLAAPLAVAIRATSLSEAVQRSREQIVGAREEERRRLRRDLHDGLGPALTGVAFTADAARNLLRTDPDRADSLIADLRERTTEAIEDIRRLVYALRPPSLDELGLVGALHRQADHLSTERTSVAVLAPADPPPLPAAVEVAAFRIAVEAVNNAVRHSDATRIQLLVVIDDTLELTITDNGSQAQAWQPGVGLTSMRERTAELGGTLEAGGDTAGGRVHAKLPL